MTRPLWTVSAALGTLFAGLYAALSLVRFGNFTTPSWDNAIFEQGIKGYAQWGAPIVDVKAPGFNQLGDHFSPALALIAPVYRAFPSAQTLLITQAVLLGLSVAVVGAVAGRHVGRARGVCVAVAYGLSFGVQSAVVADFHEVALAAPLLALAGAAYLDRDWRRVVLWSLPLLLVKEDMGLTVASIGAVLWLAGRRRRGVLLAAVGLVTMTVVTLVVVAHFSPTGEWAYATKFGGERSMPTVFLDQPGRKLLTVALTFGVTGMLALASPWALLAWPILIGRFVADKEFYWGTDWHYSLVLMPIVFIALIDVMCRNHEVRWLHSYATRGGAVAVAFAAAMQLHAPLSTLLQPASYQPSARTASANHVIGMIPAHASVETDVALITHLVTDHTVYWLGTVGAADPEYVAFDTQAGLGSPDDAVAYAEGRHGGSWRLLYDGNGFQLAHRVRE